MRREKYLKDYTVRDVVGSDGKLRSEAVYTGSLFSFRDGGDRLRRSKLICSAAALVCCLSALVPLVIAPPVTRCLYAMLPLVLALLPVFGLCSCIWLAIFAKTPVTRRQKDRIDGRLAAWGSVLLALSALSAVGQVVYYIRSAFTPADLPVTVGTSVLIAASIFFLKMRNAFQMDEIAAD
ncbi:MAG: hypothetical protein IKI49_06380 [Oscillospiraceae bacterium]|nr:hypothetical protein [Oscillospiraceae bacterium]